MEQKVQSKRTPVRVYCHQCGAPAGYDIIGQTYRCAYCGADTGVTEAHEQFIGWRRLNRTDEVKQTELNCETLLCPACGGRMIFPTGEGTAKCDYCDTKLVRGQLTDERMPEMIIPFVLTQEEAKQRLSQWAKMNRRRPEAKAVKKHIEKIEGIYLFFDLVRGPVSGEVEHDKADRIYHCKGYIEGNAVNMNLGCNNAVLDECEPFDWTQAKLFHYGYLASQRVRLADASGEDAQVRILSEVENDFLPEVCRAMKTQASRVKVSAQDMEIIPVLLPFYIIREGRLFAAINGQTGRVAVSTEKTKKMKSAWFIEPILYTLLYTAGVGFATNFEISMMFVSFMIFFGAFFGLMYYSRLAPIRTIILRSQASRARRERGELIIEEGRDILKNSYDNTPVFYERDKNGREAPVTFKFYTIGRMLLIVTELIIFNFAPFLIAAGIRLLQTAGTGEGFFDYFDFMGGASWYVVTAFIALLYWTRGVRRDIYNHPIVYEILPNGKKRRFGGFFSSQIGLVSMLGLNEVDKSGRQIPFKEIMNDTGIFTVIVILIAAVFLFFNTAAIIM